MPQCRRMALYSGPLVWLAIHEAVPAASALLAGAASCGSWNSESHRRVCACINTRYQGRSFRAKVTGCSSVSGRRKAEAEERHQAGRGLLPNRRKGGLAAHAAASQHLTHSHENQGALEHTLVCGLRADCCRVWGGPQASAARQRALRRGCQTRSRRPLARESPAWPGMQVFKGTYVHRPSRGVSSTSAGTCMYMWLYSTGTCAD